MKVIERKNKVDFEFRILKPIPFIDGVAKPGEIRSLPDGSEVWGLAKLGKLEPVDIEDGQVYVALKPIRLPGMTEKFECKPFDLIALTKADALKLMIDRSVLPQDDRQWRPFGMRLKKGSARLRRK
jgi:hypothetical protein